MGGTTQWSTAPLHFPMGQTLRSATAAPAVKVTVIVIVVVMVG
jgi:hypothetical protein